MNRLTCIYVVNICIYISEIFQKWYDYYSLDFSGVICGGMILLIIV